MQNHEMVIILASVSVASQEARNRCHINFSVIFTLFPVSVLDIRLLQSEGGFHEFQKLLGYIVVFI